MIPESNRIEIRTLCAQIQTAAQPGLRERLKRQLSSALQKLGLSAKASDLVVEGKVGLNDAIQRRNDRSCRPQQLNLRLNRTPPPPSPATRGLRISIFSGGLGR